MAISKTPISFQYLKEEDSAKVLALILDFREGRFPIQRAAVNAYGVLEVLGKDGLIEVIGTHESPCDLSVIEQLRNCIEGLLVVEFDKERNLFVSEQNISARIFE